MWTTTGCDSENSGSCYTNWNWYAKNPVPASAGYSPILVVASYAIPEKSYQVTNILSICTIPIIDKTK